MKKFLAVVLCFMWMGVIFYNSSNTGVVSNDKSYAVEDYLKKQYSLLKKILEPLIKDEAVKISSPVKQNMETESNVSLNNKSSKKENVLIESSNKKSVNNKENINLIIRKNAHAFEYLILALLISNLLFSFSFKGKKAVIYILFICLFYAVTDEFHQIFVVGRMSSIVDVLIDFLGSIAGISLFYLIYYGYFKYKSII